MLNTGNDLKKKVKSDSVLLTSEKYDLKKQHSVTQATQTSPEVPWRSQSVNFPECFFDFTREQVMGKLIYSHSVLTIKKILDTKKLKRYLFTYLNDVS